MLTSSNSHLSQDRVYIVFWEVSEKPQNLVAKIPKKTFSSQKWQDEPSVHHSQIKPIHFLAVKVEGLPTGAKAQQSPFQSAKEADWSGHPLTGRKPVRSRSYFAFFMDVPKFRLEFSAVRLPSFLHININTQQLNERWKQHLRRYNALDHNTASRPRCRLIYYDHVGRRCVLWGFSHKIFPCIFFILLCLSSGAASNLCNNHVWQRKARSTLFPCCSAFSPQHRTLVHIYI